LLRKNLKADLKQLEEEKKVEEKIWKTPVSDRFKGEAEIMGSEREPQLFQLGVERGPGHPGQKNSGGKRPAQRPCSGGPGVCRPKAVTPGKPDGFLQPEGEHPGTRLPSPRPLIRKPPARR